MHEPTAYVLHTEVGSKMSQDDQQPRGRQYLGTYGIVKL